MVDVWKSRRHESIDIQAFQHNLIKIPRQTNGYDCGAYVCRFAEHAIQLLVNPTAPLTVKNGNMESVRHWVAAQIYGSQFYQHLPPLKPSDLTFPM